MRRIHQTALYSARRLSSGSSSKAAKTFAAQRSEYQDQLSELRKQWKDEFVQKEKAKQETVAAERQRIVLDRAIKLREERKLSQERQEMAKKRREVAAMKFREKLARTHLLHDVQVSLQQRRDARARQDVAEESHFWITADNVDSKITEQLFASPGASTGLTYVFSQSLAYQTFVPTIHRMLTDGQYQNLASAQDNEEHLAAAKESDKEVLRRLLVENFVRESVGVASEREAYEDIVQDFLQQAEALHLFDEVDGLVEAEYSGGLNAAAAATAAEVEVEAAAAVEEPEEEEDEDVSAALGGLEEAAGELDLEEEAGVGLDKKKKKK